MFARNPISTQILSWLGIEKYCSIFKVLKVAQLFNGPMFSVPTVFFFKFFLSNAFPFLPFLLLLVMTCLHGIEIH